MSGSSGSSGSSGHDDLVRRLRALGEQPVDGALASQHLTAMAGEVAAGPGRRRFGRMAVAGAALAGFLFGGLGLGWADALPGPAQGVADEVLERVGVSGPWRNRGECVSTAARQHKGDTPEARAAREAAKAECPKGARPEGAGSQGEGRGKPDKVHRHAGDPCKGPPPWAGAGGGPTPEQQAEFDAQRAACPPDTDTDDAEGAELEGADDEQGEVELRTEGTTPTTEAPPETTTTSTTATTEPEDTTSSTTEDTTSTTEASSSSAGGS